MTDYYDLILRLENYFSGTGILVGLEAADAIAELEQKLTDMNAAWQQDMDRASQCLRERDEAREAVQRMAYAVDALLSGERDCDVIAVGILNDDVVKRIVEEV